MSWELGPVRSVGNHRDLVERDLIRYSRPFSVEKEVCTTLLLRPKSWFNKPFPRNIDGWPNIIPWNNKAGNVGRPKPILVRYMVFPNYI